MSRYHRLQHTTQKGFLVLSLLLTTVFIILLMVATMQIVVQNHSIAVQDTYKLQSQLAADSGADFAIEQLLTNSEWQGTGGEVELSDNTTTRTTYDVDVIDAVDGQTKTLAVYGYTYVPASSVVAKATSKIDVVMNGNGASGIEGSISAYVGVGGLILSGSSAITDGIVFSNGPISISGTAKIGSASNSVDTYVANLTCPIDGGAGYPRICAAGENDNPINITTGGNHIYGQVKANNQTSGTGMTNPGLVAGTVPSSKLPNDGRPGIIQSINGSGEIQTGAEASCNGDTSKTWPADLKIVGDVSIASGCELTVSGDVWITGNMTIGASSEAKVLAGLTTPPHILIDGSTGFELLAGGDLIPNANDTGFRIITFYSTDSCSTSESGCEVYGTPLFSSKSITTILINGSTSSLKTQFYARWSKVLMNGSADVGSLVGQTLELNGSAEIHAGVEIDPSQPGTLAWTVGSYRRAY